MVKGKISLKKSGAGFEAVRKSLELLTKKKFLSAFQKTKQYAKTAIS